MKKYSYKASVDDCGYCSNRFTDRYSVIVVSIDRKRHRTCLGKGEHRYFVMDNNDASKPMLLKDPDITCRCADCYSDIPVDSSETGKVEK